MRESWNYSKTYRTPCVKYRGSQSSSRIPPARVFRRMWRRRSWVCGDTPDSKVHGTNMGPIWGRQDPDGPHHVVPMDFALWYIMRERL